MAEKTCEKVRFSYGLYSAYSGSNVNDVYFATDKPWVHAQGIWRGVKSGSVVTKSSENDTLRIVTGFTDTTELTIDVDLTKIATTATQRNDWNAAATFVKSITGTDTTDVIDHWNEVVDFLAGIEGTTLQAIMNTKANKATKVFGLKGQNNEGGIVVECVDDTGNNPTSKNVTLAENFRIGIDNQMTAGTYTKLTVDEFGLATAGTTLAASDIPTLAISKISGLQAALDDKLTGTDEIGTAFPLSGGGPLNEEPTISLLYDNSTLVVDGTSHKLKVGTITQSQVSGLSTTLAGYVPTSRTISAGDGLTGGGDLTANRTLSVKAADASINVSSSGVKVVSAPKLTTAINLWGNSFDGTATISSNIKFFDTAAAQTASRGMRIKSDEGFIGFSKILGEDNQGSFTGISLSWGANPEADAVSVRINNNIFTYKGKPIYYKGLAQFTTDVKSLIKTELTPMATDFTALANRVTDVENQLKWIEVS